MAAVLLGTASITIYGNAEVSNCSEITSGSSFEPNNPTEQKLEYV